MAKYRIHLQTVASATVEVEVPDGMTDPEEISEYAAGLGLEPEPGSLGEGQTWSIHFGQWETSTHPAGKHEGVAVVTDMDGEDVTGDY